MDTEKETNQNKCNQAEFNKKRYNKEINQIQNKILSNSKKKMDNKEIENTIEDNIKKDLNEKYVKKQQEILDAKNIEIEKNDIYIQIMIEEIRNIKGNILSYNENICNLSMKLFNILGNSIEDINLTKIIKDTILKEEFLLEEEYKKLEKIKTHRLFNEAQRLLQVNIKNNCNMSPLVSNELIKIIGFIIHNRLIYIMPKRLNTLNIENLPVELREKMYNAEVSFNVLVSFINSFANWILYFNEENLNIIYIFNVKKIIDTFEEKTKFIMGYILDNFIQYIKEYCKFYQNKNILFI